MKYLLIALMTLLFSACGKGLDQTPDMASFDLYKPKIDQDFTQAKPQEVEAFNYAVSNVNFDQLKEKYAGNTYRDIAKKELTSYLSGLEAQWAEIEKIKPQLEKQQADFNKIKVEVVSSEITHDKFFDKWDVRYTMKITNGSNTPLSKVQLAATLGINNQAEVLYEFNPTATFANGLRAGESTTVSGNMVGFLSFDKPITLAVRESKSREIKAQVIDAADFSEQWLIGQNTPIEKMRNLPTQIATVKQHLSHLN